MFSYTGPSVWNSLPQTSSHSDSSSSLKLASRRTCTTIFLNCVFDSHAHPLCLMCVCVCVCVVSVTLSIVKYLALPPCALDVHCENPLYYYYYSSLLICQSSSGDPQEEYRATSFEPFFRNKGKHCSVSNSHHIFLSVGPTVLLCFRSPLKIQPDRKKMQHTAGFIFCWLSHRTFRLGFFPCCFARPSVVQQQREFTAFVSYCGNHCLPAFVSYCSNHCLPAFLSYCCNRCLPVGWSDGNLTVRLSVYNKEKRQIVRNIISNIHGTEEKGEGSFLAHRA